MTQIDRLERSPDSALPTANAGRSDARSQQVHLKRLLKLLDVCGLAAGWFLAYATMVHLRAADGSASLPLAALGITGIATSLVVMASKRLWLARVCAVRSAQLEGLGQMAVLSALVVLAVGQLTDYDAPDRYALLGALFSLVFVTTSRMVFETWLRAARRRGRFARLLVIFGASTQSAELAQLINRHPESGYQVVGVCGHKEQAGDFEPSVQWLGEYADGPDAIVSAGASGALVVGSAFEPSELNTTIRRLLRRGLHVHLASGLRGVSHERLLPQPLLREPVFYLEAASLTRSQMRIKRAMDVVVASLASVVVVPVVMIAALAIKLDDRGPVLFRQRRVGRGGRHFTVFKLRTMVPDAEAHLHSLRARNQRTGPLFKMIRDPRVTRVGHFLRATSIDELPQLFNVLRGDMSLVGPRPALPDEVAAFDDELRERSRMMPGITGLWQVEARDDPSFDSYRRLDLFYVDNWSIGLDLAVLLSTVGVVVPRGLRTMRRSGTPV